MPGKGNSPHNGPEAESSLVSSGRGKRLVRPQFRKSGQRAGAEARKAGRTQMAQGTVGQDEGRGRV